MAIIGWKTNHLTYLSRGLHFSVLNHRGKVLRLEQHFRARAPLQV